MENGPGALADFVLARCRGLWARPRVGGRAASLDSGEGRGVGPRSGRGFLRIVARELRLEIGARAGQSADGGAPVVGAPLLEGRMAFFAEQLARLEIVVDDAAGAAEQVGIESPGEISALAAAVEREWIDLEQATHEWASPPCRPR